MNDCVAHHREIVLVRTHFCDDELTAFASELAAISGSPVVFCVDESHGPIDTYGLPQFSLNRRECRGLRLHSPPDFAWKCGDYCLYLARKRFPEVSTFWMFEYDVRIAGSDPSALFSRANACDADFIAGHFYPASDDWPWAKHASNRLHAPYQCLFAAIRISARAIDVLLQKRQEHSRQPLRRLLWPNDESFVATTIVASGLRCSDFNTLGDIVYDSRTFSFDQAIDGDDLPPTELTAQLFHPVLFGEALAKKRTRLRQRETRPPNLSRTLRRRALGVIARTHRMLPW